MGKLPLAPGVPARSTPADSTATRSWAASRARGRPTRSGWSSSGCCSRPSPARDPGSELRLCEARRDEAHAPRELAERYAEAARGIAVRRAGDGLRLRVAELEPGLPAAALRLDPVADREEYALSTTPRRRPPSRSWRRRRTAACAGASAPGRSASRAGRSGPAGGPSPLRRPRRPDGPRCLVVDLGSLETAEEQALVAEATLAALWRRRNDREPLLLVIDEAHNVCPSAPESMVAALATEHAVRIAGEGRKFGLYLLAATQRPQKVHENVLSQCDNLALMRMNSLADLAYLSEVFSFVPPLAARAGDGVPPGRVARRGQAREPSDLRPLRGRATRRKAARTYRPRGPRPT